MVGFGSCRSGDPPVGTTGETYLHTHHPQVGCGLTVSSVSTLSRAWSMAKVGTKDRGASAWEWGSHEQPQSPKSQVCVLIGQSRLLLQVPAHLKDIGSLSLGSRQGSPWGTVHTLEGICFPGWAQGQEEALNSQCLQAHSPPHRSSSPTLSRGRCGPGVGLEPAPWLQASLPQATGINGPKTGVT